MKKKWTLTQDAFDSLLNWLDPDRELAGHKYERIRRGLIKIFACRGWRDAEELADESINRVTTRVDEVARTFQGDPSLYFYGVAHNLHLEESRKKQLRLQVPAPTPPDETEADAYDCLDECMSKLPPKTRDLVLRYYQDDRRAKIDNRKQLAQELGIGFSALRIRAHRIRVPLRKCVESCLKQAGVKGFG
jgi:DNA-directed RNA polymerase specialized sigma24 family protein